MSPGGDGRAGERSVLRTDLVTQLRARFEVPVVAVVAGAGFGKTTALRQAVHENALAPRGTDCWITCDRAQRVPSRFLSDLDQAAGGSLGPRSPRPEGPLGFGDDPITLIDDALEHAARRWPLGVAIIFDDVHLLAGSESEPLLRHLVAHRTAPVRVVLASRTPINWLAPLRSSGEVLDLHEDDLRFDRDELATLAEARDVEVAGLDHLGGWPALVDLAASFGVSGAVEFVEEEVLARMTPDERRDLAAIALVGGGDADVLQAALGRPGDPQALAGRLPMTSLGDDGGLVVHPLWSDLLGDALSGAETVAIRRRVADGLLGRGQVERAAGLYAAAEDWDGFEHAVAATWRHGYIGAARDLLADWLGVLPIQLHDRPVGLLLRGAAARIHDSFGERARDLLADAVDRCRAAGTLAGELAALAEYGYVCRVRGEIDRLVPVLLRLSQLGSEGHPEAVPFVGVAEAAMADISGDDRGVLASLAAIEASDLGAEWYTAIAYLRLGAAARLGLVNEVRQATDDCVRYGGPRSVVGRFAPAMTAWYLGEPHDALRDLPDLVAQPGLTRVEQFVLGARAAVVEAAAGRLDRAQQALAAARAVTLESVQLALRVQLVIAEAAVAVARTDEASGAALLDAYLAEVPLDDERLVRTNLALVHVLVPSARRTIDEMDLGPILAVQRDAARAVVGARGDGPAVPPQRWPSPDQLLCALPLAWVAHLAASVPADRVGPGGRLADRLVEVHGDRGRRALRAISIGNAASTSPAIEANAQKLLGDLAVTPTSTLHLDLLGPTVLRRGQVDVEHPDWDRDLVRTLLCFVALRGAPLRSTVHEQLWPDLDPDHAARNLRAHVALLQGVLEPDRQAGEAPFLLRQEGEALVLAGAPHVVVDAHQLTIALRRCRQGGSVSALDEALGLWRGTPLRDLPDLPWVADTRAELVRTFIDAALLVGRSYLAEGSPDRSITRAIDTLQVDPWSEDAYQLLVAGHIAAGDRSAARRALHRCQEMLGELGVPPNADTRLLARQLQVAPDAPVASDAAGDDWRDPTSA